MDTDETFVAEVETDENLSSGKYSVRVASREVKSREGVSFMVIPFRRTPIRLISSLRVLL